MLKNVRTGSYTYKGEAIDFNFSTNLRAMDKVRFVNAVSGTVVDGEEYHSVLRDLIFNFEIINTFTDVDLSVIKESPNTIDAIEDFLIDTNIVEIVVANADEGLIEELSVAVDRNIEYKTGVHNTSIMDSISGLFKVLERKVNEIDTEAFMEMANKLNGISEELTPDKLLEAYSKTDMFKKRFEEIEKKNKEAAVVDVAHTTTTRKRTNKRVNKVK